MERSIRGSVIGIFRRLLLRLPRSPLPAPHRPALLLNPKAYRPRSRRFSTLTTTRSSPSIRPQAMLFPWGLPLRMLGRARLTRMAARRVDFAGVDSLPRMHFGDSRAPEAITAPGARRGNLNTGNRAVTACWSCAGNNPCGARIGANPTMTWGVEIVGKSVTRY